MTWSPEQREAMLKQLMEAFGQPSEPEPPPEDFRAQADLASIRDSLIGIRLAVEKIARHVGK